MGGSTALALLPILISGYLFNTVFYPLRYFSGQADGQKLFFLAAGSGLLIAAFVFVVGGGVATADWFIGSPMEAAARAIDRRIPVPHACLLVLSMLVAVALGFLGNGLLWIRFGRRGRSTAKQVYNRLTDRFGNALCQILRRGADQQKLVLLNLKSRKVYCGRILEVPPNIELDGACIELLPSFSGYREKDTLRFGKERTEYPVIEAWEARQYAKSRKEVLEEFDAIVARIPPASFPAAAIESQREVLQRELDEAVSVIERFGGRDDLSLEDWIKVFPISEIESASFYDADAYREWFRPSARDRAAAADAAERTLAV